MIDAHCHLDRSPIFEELEKHLAMAHQGGVHGFVVAGVDAPGWARQKGLSLAHSNIWSAYGCHPWTITAQNSDTQLNKLASFLELNLCGAAPAVAIGETGLDYVRAKDAAHKQQQQKALQQHLQLAKHFSLPLILHIVSAHQDALAILKANGPLPRGAMIHSFSGSAEIAKAYLSLGLYLSFSGALTDPNRKKLRSALAIVPKNRLMIETDSPDQTPLALRPSTNAPVNLPIIAQVAADIRNENPHFLGKFSEENTRIFFNL